MKHLYVMISHTNTGFGRAIRFITGCYYNHSAIAFDEDLQQLYSFARKMYDIPLSAGLTQEHASMYTLAAGMWMLSSTASRWRIWITPWPGAPCR